jgi:hypothetical protein
MGDALCQLGPVRSEQRRHDDRAGDGKDQWHWRPWIRGYNKRLQCCVRDCLVFGEVCLVVVLFGGYSAAFKVTRKW